MDFLRGLGVALVTPFKSDGAVDWQALERILDYVIAGGVDYLVVLGTTGETSVLSSEEKSEVIRFALDINRGRLPVVVGIGGNNTGELSAQLGNFDVQGVEAVLSVCPYYVRPTQQGLFRHFSELAGHSRKPLILYNVPSRTGVNMEAATSIRLAREVRNIIAIKDATTSLDQFHQLITAKPPGFMILSGDDATALPAILSGADGVISVIGQAMPSTFSYMIQAGLRGEAQRAYTTFHALSELTNALFEEGNPTGVKALLSKIGLAGPAVRLPLLPASESLNLQIGDLLQKLCSSPIWKDKTF